MRSRTAGLGVLLLLAACVGGGGGDDPPPPEPESAAGAWEGPLTRGGEVINDANCLVTNAGETLCLLFDPDNDALAGAVHGNIEVSDGDQITGSGTSYAAPGYTLADGESTVAGFTVTGGTVSERSTLELSVSAPGPEDETFSGTFNSIFDRGSSLETVAGNYTQFDVFGDTASFSINDNGELTYQTDTGCVGNGQVSVIDADANAYGVSLTVSNCSDLGLDGSYDGLALTVDAEATNDTFLFGVFDGDGMILGAPRK